MCESFKCPNCEGKGCFASMFGPYQCAMCDGAGTLERDEAEQLAKEILLRAAEKAAANDNDGESGQ